jgi:hypothetical protein
VILNVPVPLIVVPGAVSRVRGVSPAVDGIHAASGRGDHPQWLDVVTRIG